MTDSLAKRAKRLGYPVLLQEPFLQQQSLNKILDALGVTANEESHIHDAMYLRLQILAKHYGVDLSKDGLLLAIRVAVDWIPGFQMLTEPKRGQGRQKKRCTYSDHLELVRNIEAVRAEKPGRSLAEACRFYLSRKHRGSKTAVPTPRTIENQYRDSKKLVVAMENVFTPLVANQGLTFLDGLGLPALDASPAGNQGKSATGESPSVPIAPTQEEMLK